MFFNEKKTNRANSSTISTMFRICEFFCHVEYYCMHLIEFGLPLNMCYKYINVIKYRDHKGLF